MKRTVLLIWIAAAILRIGSFLVSDNAGGDALARAALTAQWLQHPGLQLHFHVWLPVHFWLIAATSFVVPNIEVAARLLSLILGIVSVALVSWLVRELDSTRAAIFSTIAFACYSLHIGYSTTSSCDVPYLFFTLAGLTLFFYSRNKRADWPLACAGLFLTCAAGIRYEAWIVAFGLNVILLYRRLWRGFAFFAPACAVFPVFWMIYEWRTRGNPLYAPVLNHSWVAHDLHASGTSLVYRLALPLLVTTVTLTPVAVLGALNAVRQGWTKNKLMIVDFSAVAIFFAAVQLYQILAGGVMSYARYTLTLGTMVAVLSGIGLQRLAVRPWAFANVMSVNLILLCALGFSHTALEDKARSISPVLSFRRYLSDAGGYLMHHRAAGGAMVFDNYNDEANELASLAGYPLLPNNREFIVPDANNHDLQVRKLAQLDPFVAKQRPVYLVYAPAGEMSSFLSLPSACSTVSIANTVFQCVFSNGQYYIYRRQS